MSDWDRQTTPGAVEGPQWVSAAEAADVAGVTPGTVRYWARNGLIVSEVVEGPGGEKTLVRLDEVLQHARQEGPQSAGPARGPVGPGVARPPDVVTDLPARTSELAPILKSIPEIMAQLTAATDRAARAETKVEFLSAQVADLRRRLAEAEAGRDGGSPASALPDAWEGAGETPAAETAVSSPVADERAPGAVTGWPAPPPSELRDEPPEEAPEPGPESIDWTSGTVAGEETPAAEEAPAEPAFRAEPASQAVSEPAEESLSLADIWNQPATARTPAAEAPAPQADEPEGGIDWHEPAGGPPPPPAADEEPAPTPRLANAPVPEGDDFYGPRRRRWFKRRR